MLFNAHALHVRWTYVDAAGDRHDVFQRFNGTCRAVITPDHRFVAVWTSDPKYAVPCNGVVFNANGSPHRKVCPPSRVEHAFREYDRNNKLLPTSTVRSYPADMLDGVELRDGKVVYAINFVYEWNQLRVFEPEDGIWGEVVGAYRR